MTSAFALLCRELTDIQVRLLRRDGAPSALVREALSLIYERKGCLRPTLYEQNTTDTSTFLRCCASIMKYASSSEYALVHNVLLSTTAFANNYINQEPNKTNELCHVLRSIIALNECQKAFTSSLSASPVATLSTEHKMEIKELKEERIFFEESSQRKANNAFYHNTGSNNNPVNEINTQSSTRNKNKHINNNNDDCYYYENLNNSLLQKHNLELCNDLEPNMLTLEQLITPTFQLAYDKWKRSSSNVHVISLLTLLNACSIVYGHTFHFSSMHTNMFGLLPCKNKMQMEAKLQRCYGARDILTALRDLELSRIDAGMCLACMASTGLYDPVVCDASCSELRANKELVTCQQLCEIVYNLGVLQHRHIHLSSFSNSIDAKKCTAEGVRRHAIGLAMLRQSPHNVKTFMDGIFLHALRAKKGQYEIKNKNLFQDNCYYSPTRQTNMSNNYSHLEQTNSSNFHGVTSNSRNNYNYNSNYMKWNKTNENNYTANLTECNNNNNNNNNSSSVQQERLREANVLSNSPILMSDSDYVLHPIWYVDVAHALACMQIRHHKFQLMTARQVRSSIHSFSTLQRCKLLYGVGGEALNTVPVELLDTWRKKVIPVVNITVDKLNCISPEDKPYVINALMYCNIKEHKHLPLASQLHEQQQQQQQQQENNPVETLLRTWTVASQEQVIELTEQINSTTLGNDGAAEKLTAILVAVANSTQHLRSSEFYRFSALCASLDVHANEMSTTQLLQAINAFVQIGLHKVYERTLISVLNSLWCKRNELSNEQKEDCIRIVRQLQHLEIARDMLAHLQHNKMSHQYTSFTDL